MHIFKNMIFQRRQKALWSKGLKYILGPVTQGNESSRDS